jgi:hypothetical protein
MRLGFQLIMTSTPPSGLKIVQYLVDVWIMLQRNVRTPPMSRYGELLPWLPSISLYNFHSAGGKEAFLLYAHARCKLSMDGITLRTSMVGTYLDVRTSLAKMASAEHSHNVNR